MPCNTTATTPSAVECTNSKRALFEATNSSASTSGGVFSLHLSNPLTTTGDPSPPTFKDIVNERKDNTQNDYAINETVCKLASLVLGENDSLMGGSPLDVTRPVDLQGEITPRDARPDSFSTSVQSEDSPRPIIVVSTQSISPQLSEEQPRPLVDEPDPRLVDALRNPRDRPLILKLEQEVITFIRGTLDSYDTSQFNSYHRMLVHKIAEFYRLTHIASPDAVDCVRLFRGHAARIPLVRLTDLACSKSPPDTPPSGPQLAVKIMRRKSPSEQGVDSDLDSSASGKTVAESHGNDSSKPMTREEKEVAYQLARARIFGDFKESLPDSPPLPQNLNEKQTSQRKNKGQDDGFQSRSQFFPVPQLFHAPENLASTFMPIPSSAPAFPAAVQSNHVLNPTAISFNPTATSYIPGRQLFPGPSHVPLSQHNNHLHGAYPLQPPAISFSTSHSNYRPTFPPNLQTMNTSSMTALPPIPQVCHGNSTVISSRLSPQGPNPAPPVNDPNRGYLHYTQVPPPQVSNNTTYPTGRQYFNHSNGNSLNNITRNTNGGWTLTHTNVVQQGRLGNSDNPFGADQPGNLRPFGLGRE